MTITPRLHSEFFDLIKHIEEIFRQKADISERAFRPILEKSIARYLAENQCPFLRYLLLELRKRPVVYNSIPDSALVELLQDNSAAADRDSWREAPLLVQS
jgi:hypothetical protein